ncbi:Imm10 family immunity protein [Burkholderia semiarida]|uniref:Imm10 family immunity protein n=1 Tax=Burkholderia semiarida TaxID=2843303 RepID=UPI003877C912
MKFEFVANDVNYTFEDGIHVLGLVDSADEPQDYVILQRGTEFDEQDRKLGQDTYYVEVCADGVAGYGGVKSVSLHAGTLNIELEDGAKWREDLSSIEIDVQGAKDREGLSAWLAAIFSGTSTTVELD